jgi:hypothetical protein
VYVNPSTYGFISSNARYFRYTSFRRCAVLLFSASQKLLKLVGEEVGQDLLYASSHLNVLSLCSYDNAVARKLYATLQIIFNDLRETVISPVHHRMLELHIVVKDVALVAPSSYDAVEGAGELSNNIVDLVRRITYLTGEWLIHPSGSLMPRPHQNTLTIPMHPQQHHSDASKECQVQFALHAIKQDPTLSQRRAAAIYRVP